MTGAELLARLDDVLPMVSAAGHASDRDGRVPDQLIRALADMGVFATLAPRAYDGHELDLETFSRIVQRVSAACPSAGWVCSFLTGASWRLLALGEEGQAEIFGDSNFVLGAGTAAPIFDVKKVDGGFRISGRTSWNSGSSHAEWFQINGLFKPEDGAPELIMFVVKREDITILDTWHILGMKGTASCDITVENVFVPDHRTAHFAPALEGCSPGHALHDNPMYRVPFLPFAMIEVLPVIVGAHRGAVMAFQDRTIARMGTFTGAKSVDKVPAQIRLAQGLARAEMAEQMLAAMISKIMDEDTDIRQPKQRAAIKLHAAMVATFCLDSVNEMARSVGGDAFRDEAPFQRYFRDINTVGRHAFLDPDTAAETFGKFVLGLPTSDPLV